MSGIMNATGVPDRPPVKAGPAGGAVDRRAPLLGEDTDRVLSELLGLDAVELARLPATRVIKPIKT